MKKLCITAIVVFISVLAAQAEMRRAEIKVFGMD